MADPGTAVPETASRESGRALVITHSPYEHPGTLTEWLPAAGLSLDILRPYDGDAVPDRVDADALIVMGGPQQAYDDGSAPWLRATKDLLRRTVADRTPTLGICLGGQLLAEATGGRVAPGDSGVEAGARLVAKRDAASGDPLFAAVPLSPVVVQWHEDAIVDLPPGAVLLAGSTRYPHQAFRVGERAWGLQFHIETPPEMVRDWGRRFGASVRALGQDPEALAERAVLELPEVEEVWRPVVERFAALALAARATAAAG